MFEYGYGLNYTDKLQNRNLDQLDLDIEEVQATQQATYAEHLYGILSTIGDYQLRVADSEHMMGVDVSRNNAMTLSTVKTKPYNYQQQQDASEIVMNSGGGQVYVQTGSGRTEDFSHYNNTVGLINFEIKVLQPAQEKVYLALQRNIQHEQQMSLPLIDVTEYFSKVSDKFAQVSIPCAYFAEQGQNFNYIDTPFMLLTRGQAQFVLANICWDVKEPESVN